MSKNKINKYIKLTGNKNKERPVPPYRPEDCKDDILMGNDNHKYISKPNKDNIYKWIKYKEPEETTCPETFFKQFSDDIQKYKTTNTVTNLQEMQKELRNKDIYLFEIGWKDVWNYIDFAWEEAKKVEDKIKNKINRNEVSIMFYTKLALYRASVDGTLSLQHNILKKDKKDVTEILHKYFGKKAKWNLSNSKVIDIKL
jgi:hypothetical protein